MQNEYIAIFHRCKNGNLQVKNCDIFLIFAQNIDGGTEAVLTSTHDIDFRRKIRKRYTPVKVIEKQRTGTGAIKRQIPLLKPKREINKYYK